MPVSKVALLGSKIQYLTANIQHSIETEDSYSDAEDELLDALEDLHTELVGPMKFLGTFFAPPDFSAMQVAYEYEIFQYVPTQPLNGGKPGPYPAISSKDLAAQVGMDEAFLVRIMRLLAANKIFSEVDDRVFAHTKLSAGMAEELVAAHLGGLLNDVYKASTSLTDTIKGGYSSAWEARFGMPMYEYFEKNLSKDRIRMAKSMAVSSQEELKELAVIFPWKDFRKVVDIGGGVGHLATYLAQVSVTSKIICHKPYSYSGAKPTQTSNTPTFKP